MRSSANPPSIYPTLSLSDETTDRSSIDHATLSGASTCGEGELKIAHDILRYCPRSKTDSSRPSQHIVITGDSDAYAHALLLMERLPPGSNIVVANFFAPDVVFDAGKALHALRSLFPGLQSVRDFCALAMFAGTDVTPRLRHGGLDVIPPKDFAAIATASNLADDSNGSPASDGSWARMERDVRCWQAMARARVQAMAKERREAMRTDQLKIATTRERILQRLARFVFANSWLLEYILHPDCTPDLYCTRQPAGMDEEDDWLDVSTVTYTHGPNIGDLADAETGELLSFVKRLHGQYYAHDRNRVLATKQKLPAAVALTLLPPPVQKRMLLSPALQRVIAEAVGEEEWGRLPLGHILRSYTQAIQASISPASLSPAERSSFYPRPATHVPASIDSPHHQLAR